MFVLYCSQRDYSQEIKFLEKITEPRYGVIKRQVIRLMEARWRNKHGIKHFDETPYELWTATNGFGDQFHVLRWNASLKDYTEMERFMEQGNYLEQDAFPDLHEAFSSVSIDLRFIIMELNMEEGVQPVAVPNPAISSETVEQALRDAETLIGTSGAPNALDRVHTALHAYLRVVCEDAWIIAADDADITTLFSQLRQKHPKLKVANPAADKMMNDVMRGLARAVDALNPVRNHNSLAHPNPLLDPPEAMLAINAMRTILHYIDSRLS